jgi:hypothetical protein
MRQAILLKTRTLHVNISSLHAKQRRFYCWPAWWTILLLNSERRPCQLCSGQSDDNKYFSVYLNPFLKVSVKSGARHRKIPRSSVVFFTSFRTMTSYYFQAGRDHRSYFLSCQRQQNVVRKENLSFQLM